MKFKSFYSIGGLFLLITGLVESQEDSLRSALNAIDRRRQDLSDYPRYEDENLGEYGYPLDESDDLAFLSPPDYNAGQNLDKNPVLERLLLEYLEANANHHSRRANHDDDVKKRISSSFRERLEQDRERQLAEIARFLAEKDREENGDEDYSNLIRELQEKYRNHPSLSNRPRVYLNGDIKKRAYYPRLNSIDIGKRNKYSDINAYYVRHYDTRNGFSNKYQDEDDMDSGYYDWNKKKHSRQRSYYPDKRFPVSKRSSTYEPLHTSEITHEPLNTPEITHEPLNTSETTHEPVHNSGRTHEPPHASETTFKHKHKRSAFKQDTIAKTDPKVAKDLSTIFGTVNTEKSTIMNPDETRSLKEEQTTKEPKQKVKSGKSGNSTQANSKEEVSGTVNDKPLQIKKKSINWSDYFGLDRRKKSNEGLDNEWLVERYYKAVIPMDNRNVEYPLQSFKNHDQPSKKESDESESHKKETQAPEEVKIAEMDAKLKNIEDTIIDDALKYTGAHESATDSQEIQEIKDRVISRLVAAYNLEKMRRALGEFKLSVAKEKERLMEQHENNEDYDISEEKRASVPRKQAIDEDREEISEEDNNIKCSQGDEDCEEQNYRTPNEILEQRIFEECPKVQRACNEIATILGHHARVFETACSIHQMCLLCSNNSWFTPTRQCNAFFLMKSFELCEGNQECQKEAQRSVKYLLDVNRSLRLEPLEECQLACPDER